MGFCITEFRAEIVADCRIASTAAWHRCRFLGMPALAAGFSYLLEKKASPARNTKYGRNIVRRGESPNV